MKQLVFTVTNELNYDQRMIRICSSLSRAGYPVLLVGKKLKDSLPLTAQSFEQKRLSCFFARGKLFYIEYNCRLFAYLLFKKIELVCAIDLDTILPCYFISVLKKTKRVYDAHELFCEMKEIVTRPPIHKFWKFIERFTVPKFKHSYTVNQPIADEFKKMYNIDMKVIRNVPVLQPLSVPEKKEKYIIYQGAVNEGRSFETLIPAMKEVNATLVICGEGNFMQQTIQLAKQNNLENKVIFKGKIFPSELRNYTINAWIGVTLFENNGMSNYYSLANRFFDYMHAGIPQLCVDYPAYHEINNQYQFAVLLHDLAPVAIAAELNKLLNDELLYKTLQQNCIIAREILNWKEEEKKLLDCYLNILN